MRKDLRKGRQADALPENLCGFEPLQLKISEPQPLRTLVPRSLSTF